MRLSGQLGRRDRAGEAKFMKSSSNTRKAFQRHQRAQRLVYLTAAGKAIADGRSRGGTRLV